MSNQIPPDTMDADTMDAWMQIVVDHAWQGVARGQSPFAAAIYAADGTQLSLETNTVRQTHEPSRHGEVNAIDSACRHLGSARLEGVWLVSTGEPCPMCAAIAAIAGIQQIAFGASHRTIADAGYETLSLPVANFFAAVSKKASVIGGIREEACNQLLLKNPKSS